MLGSFILPVTFYNFIDVLGKEQIQLDGGSSGYFFPLPFT